MSVRRVQCPACNAPANVLVTMTDIKCPSCGVVWNINNPGAVAPRTRPTQEQEEAEEATSDKAAMLAVIGGAIVFLVIGTVGITLTMKGKEDQPVAKVEAAKEPPPPIEYKEIKLPEETRRKLFFEYRQMAGSTIDKKIKVRKGSVARDAFDDMMRKMAKREITHFSLIYNITEDEVMEVVKEGTAKGW